MLNRSCNYQKKFEELIKENIEILLNDKRALDIIEKRSEISTKNLSR